MLRDDLAALNALLYPTRRRLSPLQRPIRSDYFGDAAVEAASGNPTGAPIYGTGVPAPPVTPPPPPPPPPPPDEEEPDTLFLNRLFSMIGFNQAALPAFPRPDGSLDELGDRQQIGKTYRGEATEDMT